ncbi:hypothetical protein M988_1726 [Hafnia paralvei ATCC 29927]|jgi:hypothetical protein|uniref:Lipoprotein n=1 Tax=Hafnia paralvei TaxID=546367 RepID=A0A2A2MFA6_9GAMM|nr:hypothetical protein [Hafnia paralvei]MDU1191058.1 hypothetical protein [Enterobacteriaceae bacterium]AMH18990.1 hypothetical protein AL518_13860 [Hafnia paralvei]KHS47313.1 lipoprotein precursor-like protein [Hafnia paralvei]MBU2674717.1 hypothetical protein [Hafnia paralvei]MBW2957860.1 hypothetical protein [Hafnia paralvei]
MKVQKLLLVSVVAGLLAGCTSSAERMAKCEGQGVSKDACYIAEQNRINTLNAAAEKQALENAQQQYGQATHKAVVKTGYGVTVKRGTDGIVTVNGKPAALDEKNADAAVYSQGIYQVIFYTKGKVALMENRQFKGYLK